MNALHDISAVNLHCSRVSTFGIYNRDTGDEGDAGRPARVAGIMIPATIDI